MRGCNPDRERLEFMAVVERAHGFPLLQSVAGHDLAEAPSATISDQW
jgi:hypothetical protein